MARTTLPTHPQNVAPQSEQSSSSQLALTIVEDPQPSPPLSQSTLTIVELVAKIITLVSLIVSTSVLASNSADVIGLYGVPTMIRFSDIISYRYVLSASIIGLAYTLFQLPSSIQQFYSGKPSANHLNYLVFYFLADKVVLALLATGAGAAFAVTVDLKRNMDTLEDLYEYSYADTRYALLRLKLDDFYNRAYVPATFLLIAFITTGVSSVLSSLALIKKPS